MRELRKRPEGWRTLRVGEVDLWWSVGAPRVAAPLLGERGEAPSQAITLTLTVVRADGSGKQLVATIHERRAITVPSAGFGAGPTVAIEPGAVRRLVEQAAPRGAWPTGRGRWTTDVEIPQRPLPPTLTPEHLDRVAIVWKQT